MQTRNLRKIWSDQWDKKKIFYKIYLENGAILKSPVYYHISNDSKIGDVVVSDRGSKGVYFNGNSLTRIGKGIHVFRTKKSAIKYWPGRSVFKVLCKKEDLVGADKNKAAFMKVKIIEKV